VDRALPSGGRSRGFESLPARLLRLAIVSDTHLPRGRRSLPAACVERLAAADMILHAGDFMELPVYEWLRGVGPPVWAVRGNVDSAELQARLPLTRVVEAGRARFGMVHDAGPASGRLARMRARFGDADVVVFGHSHLPLIEWSGDRSFAIFNPGSPTERRRAPVHTMGEAVVHADGRVDLSLVELSP
jgi:putative phosphoesterase